MAETGARDPQIVTKTGLLSNAPMTAAMLNAKARKWQMGPVLLSTRREKRDTGLITGTLSIV